ncbi:MAG: hypothetical protein NVS1B1_06310 [Candidatus Limnocylindrales bacterium]
MEKPGVLRPSTPGGHRTIGAAWLAAVALTLVGAVLYALRTPAATPVSLLAAALFAFGTLGYAVRHARFVRSLGQADTALAGGDLVAARDILAPLLDRFPGLPAVSRASGRLLYAAGDPLSAATLLERSAPSFRGDPELAVTLVASYAALNKAGDARRAAELLPAHPDVRLAVAWAELVALGGDRARGAVLAAGLPTTTPARAAMAAVLRAVAAAQRGDTAAVRTELRVAEDRESLLSPAERAFLAYLGGVALRVAGATQDARDTFSAATEMAPGTIGEALARRERSHLPAEAGGAQSGSSSGQSPSD